jgi:hypothetical protein
MNRFRLFTDEELDALAAVVDTFAPDVAAWREPHLTLVHEYKGELAHRRNRNLLAERDRQRGLDPVAP